MRPEGLSVGHVCITACFLLGLVGCAGGLGLGADTLDWDRDMDVGVEIEELSGALVVAGLKLSMGPSRLAHLMSGVSWGLVSVKGLRKNLQGILVPFLRVVAESGPLVVLTTILLDRGRSLTIKGEDAVFLLQGLDSPFSDISGIIDELLGIDGIELGGDDGSRCGKRPHDEGACEQSCCEAHGDCVCVCVVLCVGCV